MLLLLTGRACAASFFLLHLLQSFCHLLKTLLKTLYHRDLKLVLSLPVGKVCNSGSLFQSIYYCLGFSCFLYYHGIRYSWVSVRWGLTVLFLTNKIRLGLVLVSWYRASFVDKVHCGNIGLTGLAKYFSLKQRFQPYQLKRDFLGMAYRLPWVS